ncbi:MAG TPA: ABC transporter permease subunit [Clostridiales bacterium]|nr:ABC transporter permease subunit [Clostridiales bacterium]
MLIANAVKKPKQTGNAFKVNIISFIGRIRRAFMRDKYLYLMFLLPLLYYIIFHYVPMYGILIAFKKIKVFRGLGSILEAPWNGAQYFKEYLKDPYFWKLVRNTILIRIYDIAWGFPVPIIFALLLNEVRNNVFKRTIQSITYLPHFLSTVVICGMITTFLATDGLINNIIKAFGGEAIQFLAKSEWFRTVFIASGIWQNFGWESIIYIASLTAIDVELYDAARIDGAGRWKQTIHVSLPGIMPTIIILFILNLGKIMNVGYQKILLLYNGATYETADVISTFVYRRGLIETNFSYATAVGLFSTVIGLMFIISANKISKKVGETSLW